MAAHAEKIAVQLLEVVTPEGLLIGDLLRFLHEEGDGTLTALGYGQIGGNPPQIPVTLFTMGNPLRQLLNRFFPYLYDWVRDRPDSGSHSLPASQSSAPVIPDDAAPVPAEIGVQRASSSSSRP